MARTPPAPLAHLTSALLLAGFGLFWYSDTIADPDLWGHVRFGLDLLRTGSIIQTDTYSYRTAGSVWINHEWLAEVIFAAVYDRWEAPGLIVLKLLVSLLILGTCSVHLHRRALGPFPSVLLLVFMSIPFRMGLGTVRPQIFTYLLFLLLLLLLERGEGESRYRPWALPLIFAVWVNLHGGVLAGVGVLGLWIVVVAFERLRDDARPLRLRLKTAGGLSLLALACGLALLMNPYGARLVVFLLRTATVPRPEISEWTPLGLMSLPGGLYLLLLAAGVLGWMGSTRRRRPEAILIFCVTAVLPLLSNRHYPLFALTLVVLAGEHVADAWNRWWPAITARLGRGPGPAVAVLILVISLLAMRSWPPHWGCIRIEPFYFGFPARAVALLRQSGVRGNLAVPFTWGEYVLWHLGPGVKVSIDGRRETLYSDAIYRQSVAFERGTGDWDALLATAPPTDLVMAPLGAATIRLLSRSDRWIPLYRDAFCVVYARAGFPDLGRIVATPVPVLPDDGRDLCFPSPGRTRSRGPGR